MRYFNYIKINGNKIDISFPYNIEINEIIKQIPNRKWDNKEKIWILPLSKTTVDFLEKLFGKEEICKYIDFYTDENIFKRKNVNTLTNKVASTAEYKPYENRNDSNEFINKYSNGYSNKNYNRYNNSSNGNDNKSNSSNNNSSQL